MGQEKTITVREGIEQFSCKWIQDRYPDFPDYLAMNIKDLFETTTSYLVDPNAVFTASMRVLLQDVIISFSRDEKMVDEFGFAQMQSRAEEIARLLNQHVIHSSTLRNR